MTEGSRELRILRVVCLAHYQNRSMLCLPMRDVLTLLIEPRVCYPFTCPELPLVYSVPNAWTSEPIHGTLCNGTRTARMYSQDSILKARLVIIEASYRLTSRFVAS